MNIKRKDDELVIELTGRIDSNNASEVENEIMDAVNQNDGAKVIFDADDLSYISSAGLRVLMKACKKSGGKVTIKNVSRDVYDIFDTTGFTEIFDVQKAYRKINVNDLEVIGRGFFGTVYRLDKETIVKVYKGKDSIPMIENEKKMARKAFLAGIPTAISYDIVQVGDDYGSVFELLNASTFHDLVQYEKENVEDVIKRYISLLKLVHGTKMNKGDFPSYKERFIKYISFIKNCLDENEYNSLMKLFEDMEDENTVVHGDVQMKNVMQVGNEAMLIDMDTLGLGNPVFELAGLFVTYQEFEEDEPGNSMNFLGLSQDKVDLIWKLIVENYFTFSSKEEEENTLSKIRLVAAVRFLYLLESTDLKNGDLGETRIKHTVEHIDELLKKVKSLSI
ncbi:anti-sigma factor antagonist [Butyrivibrio sp. NC3005]|uniref:anti-sigma factor antagonist n=1 Tax=Butyrivibrio sp. NC3005 TaxID=1280685 RepID=UPI00041DFBC0|nr:anti-sigma factor antagonist [Butyrivibrio sp. NC3005]